MAKKKRAGKKPAPSTRGRAVAQRAAGTSAARRGRERRTRNPETLRLRALQPSFTVGDLQRSMQFYSDVLGFIVSQRWNADDGSLRGVMLKAGSCEIGLAQDDWKKGRDRRKGEGVRLWCTTAQDIDALAARIKNAGGKLTEGPMDLPWGGRSLSVADPDGFNLSIYREA